MAKDKNGIELAAGDVVLVPATVVEIRADGNLGNVHLGFTDAMEAHPGLAGFLTPARNLTKVVADKPAEVKKP